jgi:tripartite-type tricarboxylate transporter receptor subunit TctC
VLNRPGAGGETAYVAIQSARPDGYTLGAINTPGYLSVPIERRVRYDRAKIRPIARLVDDPTALVVRQASPHKTLRDLVEAARASRGPSASAPRASAPTTTWPDAAAGGHGNGVHPHPLRRGGAGEERGAGRAHRRRRPEPRRDRHPQPENPPLRALAAMGEKRWELMPNVPTFREEGVDVVMTSERGLAAPRGIPDEIAARLQDAVARVMAKPEWLEKAKQLELPLAYLPGAEWEAQMPAQEARYRRIWEATPWN